MYALIKMKVVICAFAISGGVLGGALAAMEEPVLKSLDREIENFRVAAGKGDVQRQKFLFMVINSYLYKYVRIPDREARDTAVKHMFDFFAQNSDNPRLQALAIGGLGRLTAEYPELLSAKIQRRLREEFAGQFGHYFKKDPDFPQYNCLNTMTAIVTTLSMARSNELQSLISAMDDMEARWASGRHRPMFSEKIAIDLDADRKEVVTPKNGSERIYNTLKEFMDTVSPPPENKRSEWDISIVKLARKSGTD